MDSLGRIQVREGFRDGLGEEEAAAAAETVQAERVTAGEKGRCVRGSL